ncbi:MAG: GNAT family N-acetyltransferase [Blastococcus sp.]
MTGVGGPRRGSGADLLRTPRLRLRRLTDRDLSAVVAIEAAPDMNWYVDGRPPTPEECAAHLRSYLQVWRECGLGYWLVSADDGAVGLAGVRPVTLADRGCWNLYYRFRTAVSGRGYATEAARRAIDEVGRAAPGEPVVAQIAPDNAPSLRVAHRLGMVRRPELDHDGYQVFALGW